MVSSTVIVETVRGSILYREAKQEMGMKQYWVLAVSVLLAFSGVAFGHAHVQKSEPNNNSTISQAPKNFLLEFNEPVQLTVLTLNKGEAKLQDLGPLPSAAAKAVTVPMPAIEAGSYIVNWRGAGDDGHMVSGKVMFTVTATASKAP